jgi:cytochrome c553
MINKITPDAIRIFALVVTLPVVAASVAVLAKPSLKQVLAHGPIQVGHESTECTDCHRREDASLRQQIQANIQFALGNRENSVDFGYLPVTSSDCLDCHERPNERHPIYRFREPRFSEAVEIVNATSCLGCHTEHTGQRSFSDVGVCGACHGDLKLLNDPVDVPHETLVRDKKWQTCLGCHDFHGNHIYKAPKLLIEAAPVQDIVDYLAAGESPYGMGKLYEAEAKR